MKVRSALVAAAGLAAGAGACIDATPTQPSLAVNSSPVPGPQPGARIEIRFNEEHRIRSSGSQLRSTRGRSLAALSRVLARHGTREVRPLFSVSEPRLERLVNAARVRVGRAAPDLGSWHEATVPDGIDATRLLADLNALPEVDTAYFAPAPAPPPGTISLATADFSSRQLELAAAPVGIDAVFARSQPGGAGQGIKIIDMEYDWVFQHEDLGLDDSILIAGARYTVFGTDHGTAVLGELGGRDNGFGVTGAVPGATLRVVGTIFDGAYLPANGIVAAAADMSVGDVLLIEQQASGPNGGGRYVPAEWIPSVFEATLVATQSGKIVVAAAGNGGENLDAPEFGGRFDRSRYDSGAIIVGAGDAQYARSGFSSYGSRVDLQGRGVGVTTTGYGDLSGTSELDYYTAYFSGTSSASAMVTAAVAAMQGHLKASGRAVLNAPQLITLLQQTGTAQTGNLAERIGPSPNLRAALEQLSGRRNRAPLANAGTAYSGDEGVPLSFSASGSSDPDGDALTYAWDFGDGSTGNGVNPTHTYANNGTYTATLTVRDSAGASDAAAAAVTISNVPPRVNAGPDVAVAHRNSFTLDARFADPGRDAWSCTINWGDRTSTSVPDCSPSSGVKATHAFKRPGRYTVRITVTDGEATGADELIVTHGRRVPGRGRSPRWGS